MKKYLYACLFAITFFACSDETTEKPLTPVTYFQVNIAADYGTTESEDWVIIQNLDGTLLSAKPFESGQTLTFDSTLAITGPLVISNFRMRTDFESYSVETFIGINPNDTWTWINTTISQPAAEPSIGKLNVNVTGSNLGNSANASLSNKYTGVALNSSSTQTNFAFRSIDITALVNDFMISIVDNQGIPKYKIIENAVPGNLSFAITELDNFDKIINVSYPTTTNLSTVVRVFENGQEIRSDHGYRTSLNLVPSSNLKLGYLNGFTNYLTSVNASYSGYQLNYSKAGSAPTSDITLQKSNTTIANKTFANYSISGNDFDIRITRFLYTPSAPETGSILWLFHSNNQYLNVVDLPAEFKARYPKFTPGKLVHSLTAFRKGTSFDSYILEAQRGKRINAYETMSTTFNN